MADCEFGLICPALVVMLAAKQKKNRRGRLGMEGWQK
jgi:hypothetical protein